MLCLCALARYPDEDVPTSSLQGILEYGRVYVVMPSYPYFSDLAAEN